MKKYTQSVFYQKPNLSNEGIVFQVPKRRRLPLNGLDQWKAQEPTSASEQELSRINWALAPSRFPDPPMITNAKKSLMKRRFYIPTFHYTRGNGAFH